MKIAIVAGGSGGHIYPALALAQGLRQKGHEITFFGSNDRMEKDVIPAQGFTYVGLDVVTTRGSIIQKIRSLLSIVFSYFRCRKLLKGYDMAIGFGNYISIPVMQAAFSLKLKTIIHEQNSYVGRANRMLDEKVDLIIGSYEENRKQFRNPNLLIAGNPQSTKAYQIQKDPKVLQDMGLDPQKRTVVIFMGSLGSASVNEKIADYLQRTDGSYQIIFATGSSHYSRMKERIEPKDYLRVYERIDGIAVMKNCDLLISRAGATTLSEICAIGIASILIPSPYVPNNHQYYNGKALVDKNAAVMIEEKDLNGEFLATQVNALLGDENRLKKLADNAKKLSNPHVLDDMIEAIEKL